VREEGIENFFLSAFLGRNLFFSSYASDTNGGTFAFDITNNAILCRLVFLLR
jgi:hypothetical protein